MSHQLFFEKFLLPNLQAFVLESVIYPSPITFEVKDGGKTAGVPYTVGYNPRDGPNEEYRRDMYRFKFIAAADGKRSCYEAFVSVIQDQPFCVAADSGPEYTKYYASGKFKGPPPRLPSRTTN